MTDAAVSRARGRTFSPRAAPPVEIETRLIGGQPVSLARFGAPPPRQIPEGERRGMSRAVDWTPEALAELRRLHAENWAMPRVARLLGVSVESVRTKCRMLGLPLRASGVPDFGAAEDALLAEMIAADLDVGVIADELGRGRLTVARRAAALGLVDGGAASRAMPPEGEGDYWARGMVQACDAHLADLRRAGHDPRATELNIGAEGARRLRVARPSLFSGCGSPAAACAGG